jgi:hypothetical protein
MGQLYAPAVVSPIETPELPRRREAAQEIDFQDGKPPNQAKTIRVPTHIGERQHKLACAARTLAPSLGREPSLEELAEATGLPFGHVRQALDCAEASASLNQAVSPDGGTELADSLADPAAADPVEEAEPFTSRASRSLPDNAIVKNAASDLGRCGFGRVVSRRKSPSGSSPTTEPSVSGSPAPFAATQVMRSSPPAPGRAIVGSPTTPAPEGYTARTRRRVSRSIGGAWLGRAWSRRLRVSNSACSERRQEQATS